MNIDKISIKKLIPADYNPRKVFLPGQLFQKLPYLPVREMTSIMSIKTERKMTSHY